MKYYTYGRQRVDGQWQHPTGLLPDGSFCGIYYLANYYGCTTGNTIDILADFDPTEISEEMFAPAYSSSLSGSL